MQFIYMAQHLCPRKEAHLENSMRSAAWWVYWIRARKMAAFSLPQFSFNFNISYFCYSLIFLKQLFYSLSWSNPLAFYWLQNKVLSSLALRSILFILRVPIQFYLLFLSNRMTLQLSKDGSLLFSETCHAHFFILRQSMW